MDGPARRFRVPSRAAQQSLPDRRQPFPYQIMEGLPVIRPKSACYAVVSVIACLQQLTSTHKVPGFGFVSSAMAAALYFIQLWGNGSNSSLSQCWKAVICCGRPRKLLTRSLADLAPPGSSTMRRYRAGTSPAKGSFRSNCWWKSSTMT